MNRILIKILPLLFIGLSIQVKAQPNQPVKAIILSKTDSSSIVSAHVINLTAKNGVISNDNGEFTIYPNKNDSISISIIGYNTIILLAKDIPTTIYLEERNYELELYNVVPYKNFNEFKEAFVKLELPDTFRHINPTIYLSKEELVQAYNEAQMGIVIPIDFSSFGKRAKDKANYDMLLQRDKYEAFLATKFNPNLVKRILKLNDVAKLNDFIAYCDFSDEFIAHNNNYNIITQIFDCYDEYIALPLASK